MIVRDDTRLVYKTTLKTEFGLTDRLIRMLGEPDKRVVNPHTGGAEEASLYMVARVKSFMREHAREFRALKRKRNPKFKERKARARDRRFNNRFPNWREALPDAAEAMFNLNRYAKHSSCKRENRTDIYALKNRILKLFHFLGFCETAHLHTVPVLGKRCYSCSGSGYSDDNAGFYDIDGICHNCDGSGWYEYPFTAEFVCFKFLVADKHYIWHQPKGSIDFEYQLVDAPTDWVPDKGEKALNIARADLSKAKQVLRFVLKHGEAEMLRHGVA